MSIRIFVDDVPNKDGKYMVLQQDSETGEPFGVKDFDTKEEAQRVAEDMQRAIDKGAAEKTTGELPDITLPDENSEFIIGSSAKETSKFKDTLQDLKSDESQE